jgi:mannitol-specific phosphotransferase system IIBC component
MKIKTLMLYLKSMAMLIGILGQSRIGEQSGIVMHRIGTEMAIVSHSGLILLGHLQQTFMKKYLVKIMK